jgi:peptidylprolyl isomerase
MAHAQAGDTVRVHYTGTLDDGTVFDSSTGREPLEFTLGEGQVIAGFEEAVTGMEVGETKASRIDADEAYGSRRDDLLLDVPREQIPAEIDLQIGQQLTLQQPNGQAVPVTVAELSDETVTLDANHPLAGEALTFELTLVEIV